MSGAAAVRYRVYGCDGASKIVRRRSLLDDAPGVHHRHAVGEVGDHRQVVGDVQRGDAVAAGEIAHRGQHERLGAHVEAGGRLVEHDHRRAAGERHRQPDPLLLAAGQLVRVAAQELRRAGQQDLAHHLDGPGPPSLVGAPEAVELHHLEELRADPQRRVQRGRRVLRHVADQLAPGIAQRPLVERQHRGGADLHRAGSESHAAPGVTEHAEADRRLARAGLADETQHLAGSDREIDLVDDVVAGRADLDAEVADRRARSRVTSTAVDAGGRS